MISLYKIYQAEEFFYVAKTKALIGSVVAAQLICAFDLAYVKSKFSHQAALIELWRTCPCPDEQGHTLLNVSEKR